MGSVSLVPGLEGLIGRSTSMATAVEAAAERIKEAAIALAPIGPTGKLAESIRVTTAFGPEGVFAKIVAGDAEAFYAGWVEFGTQFNDPNPYLTGGAEAEGYTVRGGKQ